MSCRRSLNKKYLIRGSPPFPANKCCGQRKLGNDGKMYISKLIVSSDICRWVPFRKSPTCNRSIRRKKSIHKSKDVKKKSKSRSRRKSRRRL